MEPGHPENVPPCASIRSKASRGGKDSIPVLLQEGNRSLLEGLRLFTLLQFVRSCTDPAAFVDTNWHWSRFQPLLPGSTRTPQLQHPVPAPLKLVGDHFDGGLNTL